MTKGKIYFSKYLFIVNPISGDRDKTDIFETIQKFSEEHEVQQLTVKTSGNEDEKEVAKALREYQPEVVVAVGGDGTVNLVAQQVAGTDLALGIIPMGSGNGLSKDLNIPQNNLDRSFNLLFQSNTKSIDTLTVNGHFFMHLCDIGFNARIVKLFNKGSSRGLLSYMKFTVKEFYKYRTTRYEVKTDNGNFNGKAFMITVANSNQFGTNLTINPNGEVDDGLFEVIIIKNFPRKKALRLFLQLLFKRINFSPYCIILKCREANISCRKKKTLQYDGEISGEVQNAEIKIFPKNLKVIVP